MAKKQSQKKRPQKQKIEWRRVFVAGLAVVMALLLLLPMISMIAGGVGAVTQSEIDALKEEQRESQVKQQELKNQLADVKEDQAAAQQRRQLLQQQLEAINAELDSINAQISYYDQEIAQKEAERKEAEAKEQAQYELFCERVRAMEEEGTVSYWSILFNAENFSDMLDRLADIDAVMDYDNQVMEELTAARQELERLQAELESARAEEQALVDGYRDGFDYAVSRAVASLELLCELCLPYLKVGGRFLAMKGVDSGEEINRAARCISILGGRLLPSVDYVIPGANVRHRVVLVEKCTPTPNGYPRRWAKIQKAPL